MVSHGTYDYAQRQISLILLVLVTLVLRAHVHPVYILNTEYSVKASVLLFRREIKNKEYYHGRFQQQSPQHLVIR